MKFTKILRRPKKSLKIKVTKDVDSVYNFVYENGSYMELTLVNGMLQIRHSNGPLKIIPHVSNVVFVGVEENIFKRKAKK